MIFSPLKPPKTPLPPPFDAAFRAARRGVIFIIGWSILLLGMLMVFLPGPAILVIPAGLAILALEFTWARRWLKRFKATLETLRRSPPPNH